MLHNTNLILAIESSCDDTAAAVLWDRKVLSNCIANQDLIHKAYGGIVPELASRAHQSKIIPVVTQALTEANIDKKELTAIAYTQGPGLLGSLLVGSAFAKSLALSLDLPLIPIHHMQAHLLVHFIEEKNQRSPQFPFLGVTVSGGHTQLLWVKEHFDMELLGTTLDDAIGEAFDKCGKRMGLSYPAGPEIDRLAQKGNPHRFEFPIPNVNGYDLSYSGVKTAFTNFIHKQEQKEPDFITAHLNDLCASLQYTLVQIILTRLKKQL
jgi:N6-L-threonylcarbamoyladenine synthase